MAYIEENMKLRRGAKESEKNDDGPLDPYAALFHMSKGKDKKEDEGSVTNSLAMLTAIPEVDLGMEYVYSLNILDVSLNIFTVHASRILRKPRRRSA